MSQFKQAVQTFLEGLDTNDRDRLAAVGKAAFDQYVTELPGPDTFVKAQIRGPVEKAIENLITDLCTRG